MECFQYHKAQITVTPSLQEPFQLSRSVFASISTRSQRKHSHFLDAVEQDCQLGMIGDVISKYRVLACQGVVVSL